jgi:hypothetical protein
MIGVYHHRQYQAVTKEDSNAPAQSPTLFKNIHRWFGRFLIVLAVVNGGLGLQLANDTLGGLKVYGAVAGIIGVIYVVTLVVWYRVQSSQPEAVANSTPINASLRE